MENAPLRVECIVAELGHEDRNLTIAEKDCVLTSSDDDVEDLSAFLAEKLQCLSKGSVEKLFGEECVNVEEILCGGVGIGEEDAGNQRQSVCPNVTIDGNVDVDDRGFSPDVEVDQMLREELGGATVISIPKRVVWPIYSKRESSVLREPDEPACKAVVFDVASGSGTVGCVGLSKEGISGPSEGVSGSFVESGGFSTLEGIARRQAHERFVGTCMGGEGEGMVRVTPLDGMFGQEAVAKERTRYYPSQSAKTLLKECFEWNLPTDLDPSHPTTSFSAVQKIQFARAVGLKVSLASYSMLEDLLLKARGGSRVHQSILCRLVILQGNQFSPVLQGRPWVTVLRLGRLNGCLPLRRLGVQI